MKFALAACGMDNYPPAMAPWEPHAGREEILRFAKKADSLSWDWLTIPEHLVMPTAMAEHMGTRFVEGITAASVLMGATERIHMLTFVLVLNFGAMIGAIGGGWLADRFNIKYVLMCFYALAAVSITLLGVKMPTELLFFVVGLAGASTIGTQILTYAYTGQFYPMSIRSTGIGLASGMGRSGAILAPIVIGTLVGMALPLQQNFIAIAIPAVIAVIAVGLVNHKLSASAQH